MKASQRGGVRLGTNLVNTYRLIWMMFCSQRPQEKENSTSSNLSGDILQLRSPASYNLGKYLPLG